MEKPKNWKRVCAGLVLTDRILFRRHFFRDQLSLEPSLEQKLMWCDASRRVLFCTGRKLAKCVAGDTRFYDAVTGQPFEARDFVYTASSLRIASLDREWKIGPRAARIWSNEFVPIFKVLTRSGLAIRVSGNHPFLTGAGWVEASSLKPGDLVAAAGKTPMPAENTSGLSDAEVAVIAYLMGEGGTSHRVATFTTASEHLLGDFKKWLFEIDPDIILTRTNQYDYRVVGPKKPQRHRLPHPILSLLDREGLRHKNSHTQFLPDSIFRLDHHGLALFLSRLYAVAGYVTRQGTIGYSTLSPRLANDVHDALLRFGIFAGICCKKTRTGSASYAVEIRDATGIIKFCENIGIFGKESAQHKAYGMALVSGPSQHDRFPLNLVREIIASEGVGLDLAGANAGWPFRGKAEPAQEKLDRVVEAHGLGELKKMAQGDVYWDEIESVSRDGFELTYDLNVPETHNFVANGLITHNTISLEAEIIQTGLLHKSIGDGVDEALMWTPNDVHMVPFVDRIWSRTERNPVLNGCVREKRRGDNTILEFRGGLRWYFRIEGTAGNDRNVVGLRVVVLLGDEQAFGTDAVYKSLIMSAMPNARWIMAGVPNGVRRSPFYLLDQTKLGASWSRHKYSTYINPLFYGPEAKSRLIEDYGGEETHGYKTQVLGEWGMEMFTSFPPGSIAIGDQAFRNVELARLDKDDIDKLPLRMGTGSINCKRFVLALDYGYSPDPSILTGFYSNDDESRVWRQFLRVQMVQVAQPHQIDVILYTMKTIFRGAFMGFASDHLATVQSLRSKVKPEQEQLILHSSPGSSTAFDMKVVRDEEPDIYRTLSETDKAKDSVNLHNKQLWTDWLRNWMINAMQSIESMQLWIANIASVAGELGGTTERKGERGGYIVYQSPRDPNDSKRQLDHDVDSLRFAALVIHEAVKQRTSQFSEDELLKTMGWTGSLPEGQSWSPAWEESPSPTPARY